MNIGGLSGIINISGNNNIKNTSNKNAEVSFSNTISKETAKKSKETTIDSTTKPAVNKNTAKEVKEKLDKVYEASENGDESKIIEELAALLQMLNIEIVEQTNIPIVIEIPEEIIIDTEIHDLNSFEKMIFTEVSDNNANILDDLLLEGEVNIETLEYIVSNVETNEGQKLEIGDLVNVINNKLSKSENETKEPETIQQMVFNDVKVSNTAESEIDILSKIINEGTTNNSEMESAPIDDTLSIEYGMVENSLNKFQAAEVLNSQVTAEPIPVNEATMAKDIITNVKYMSENNIQELTVKIYPEEMGEVTIKLLSEEGIMRADIKATSKETYLLLNANVEEIKKSLSNENIQIKEVNIELYSEDTTYFSGGSFEESFKNSRNSESLNLENKYDLEEEAEEVIVNEEENTNVNLLA